MGDATSDVRTDAYFGAAWGGRMELRPSAAETARARFPSTRRRCAATATCTLRCQRIEVLRYLGAAGQPLTRRRPRDALRHRSTATIATAGLEEWPARQRRQAHRRVTRTDGAALSRVVRAFEVASQDAATSRDERGKDDIHTHPRRARLLELAVGGTWRQAARRRRGTRQSRRMVQARAAHRGEIPREFPLVRPDRPRP